MNGNGELKVYSGKNPKCLKIWFFTSTSVHLAKEQDFLRNLNLFTWQVVDVTAVK